MPESPAEAPAKLVIPMFETIDTPAETDSSGGLAEFHAEGDLPVSRGESVERSGTRFRWLVGAAAAILAMSAFGAPARWYAEGQAVDGPTIDALIPAAPPVALSEPVSGPPRVEPSSSQALQSVQAAESRSAAASVPVAAERRGYSILVASFQNRDRAERLVEELASAGFDAKAVERDGGAAHGRLTLVRVSGYTSAVDVQRDLQRIRELPGGYGDARIVEQQ